MDKYAVMSLSELRKELKSRGARVSGRKKELIERLQYYERNSDFGKEKLEPEYHMKIPTYDKYKDVNTNTKIVKLKQESVHLYLAQQIKNLDENVHYLYKNRFLKFLRVADENNVHYVKAECKAQMKKSVLYCCDISIDENGTILECQCECAVGMGPSAHCKHVCVTLLAFQKFSEDSELLTEETCTQKLQTFHHTKPFHGSPIKASDLPLASETEVNFDPRPKKFRKLTGYADNFRNIWLNHPKANTFPISQLYAPANSYAIDLDHDYELKKLSELWLDEMKITSINNKEIIELEIKTRGQGKSQVWKDERVKRLHSSNFGRICKVTERTDQQKLANNYTKLSQELNTAPILHGKAYESVALKRFEEMTKINTTPCGSFVSKTHPYLAATPDALIGSDTVVEIKCPYSAKDCEIGVDTVPYVCLENGKLQLNKSHDYYYQIQGQLFCTERVSCVFIIYTFKGIQILNISRNEPFIDEMVTKLAKFFSSHFKNAVLDRFYYKNYYHYNFN